MECWGCSQTWELAVIVFASGDPCSEDGPETADDTVPLPQPGAELYKRRNSLKIKESTEQQISSEWRIEIDFSSIHRSWAQLESIHLLSVKINFWIEKKTENILCLSEYNVWHWLKEVPMTALCLYTTKIWVTFKCTQVSRMKSDKARSFSEPSSSSALYCSPNPTLVSECTPGCPSNLSCVQLTPLLTPGQVTVPHDALHPCLNLYTLCLT